MQCGVTRDPVVGLVVTGRQLGYDSLPWVTPSQFFFLVVFNNNNNNGNLRVIL
jgi:hypothetical protein